MKKSVYTLSFLIFLIVGCESEETPKSGTKLDYYIETYVFDELDYTQQRKVTYQYNDEGKLSRYTVFNYSTASNTFRENSHFDFSYINEHVEFIKGIVTVATTPYVVYSYQYSSEGRVLKIIEEEVVSRKISEANFTYNDTNASVKVTYSGAKEGGREYEFSIDNQNIVSDKTTRNAQPCSDGEYAYDQNKNPFNDFGYVDYYDLSYLSANNKLAENINYSGCVVPDLVPVSYKYKYNEHGYPTIVTTTYTDIHVRSDRKYFYK